MQESEITIPIKNDPHRIGYWCRIHDVHRDWLNDDNRFPFASAWTDDEEFEFADGFEEADDELKEEARVHAMDLLESSLTE